MTMPGLRQRPAGFGPLLALHVALCPPGFRTQVHPEPASGFWQHLVSPGARHDGRIRHLNRSDDLVLHPLSDQSHPGAGATGLVTFITPLPSPIFPVSLQGAIPCAHI